MTSKYLAIATLALPVMLLAQSAVAMERALPETAARAAANSNSMSIADLCSMGGVLSGAGHAPGEAKSGDGGAENDEPRTLQERWYTLLYKPGEQVVTVYKALGREADGPAMIRFAPGAPAQSDTPFFLPGDVFQPRDGGLDKLTT